MKDVYGHPTLGGLAAALADDTDTSVEKPVPAPVEVPTPGRTLHCAKASSARPAR